MRITADEKQATRERILAAALKLFRSQGFDKTTTRDLARAAGIAAGTLFNYFETKEAVVCALAQEALARVHAAWTRELQPGRAIEPLSLEEDLFALIAAELRQLRPLRTFLAPFLDAALSPLLVAGRGAGDEVRAGHLELVCALCERHRVAEPDSLSLQTYWALYVGVLRFWAADKSPKQEDTLALLDESLHMFAAWQQRQRTERT